MMIALHTEGGVREVTMTTLHTEWVEIKVDLCRSGDPRGYIPLVEVEVVHIQLVEMEVVHIQLVEMEVVHIHHTHIPCSHWAFSFVPMRL